MSSVAHAGDVIDIDVIADLVTELDLIPPNILGLERRQATEALLVATGVVARRSGRLEFIHYSFRSYLRAQRLAELFGPDARDVWSLVSPFREDWDTVAFVIEIWIYERRDVSAALEALLAFGEAGLRSISDIAARLPNLPANVIKASVAKWMYRDDEFWDPGYKDGPVQQLTLIASNYNEAKIALRQIAGNSEHYFEDAIYAAKGLFEIGDEEARGFLVTESRDVNNDCVHRVLAAEVLHDIGYVSEALDCLSALASEWKDTPADTALAEINLGKALYHAGRKRAGLSLLKKLSGSIDDKLEQEFLSEAYADLGYLKPAAKLAREVFNKMEWSIDLARGYRWRSLSLLNLLDRVGLKKEADFVRKGIARAEDSDPDELQRIAFNPRERPDRRLASAEELLNRGLDQLALRAFECLASDRRTPAHERFSAISPMLGIKNGRGKAIDLLRRIIEEEPSQRVACGKILILAGELEAGWSVLRRVALEPAEVMVERVDAICELNWVA